MWVNVFQVELHTDLEGKLPVKIIDMVDKMEYKYYPNKCTGFVQQVSIPNNWLKILYVGLPTWNEGIDNTNSVCWKCRLMNDVFCDMILRTHIKKMRILVTIYVKEHNTKWFTK